MPRSKVWPKLTEWSRRFGSIYRVNLAGTEAVVLGTHKAAADLLNRRSANYSDRPRSIVASELMGGGMIIGLIDTNMTWKKMRRASHETMGSTAANNYRGMQEAEAYILSYQLLQTPADWDDHLQRASNSLMLSVIYGLPPRLNSLDPNIRRTNEFVSGLLTAAAPGAYLVEYFTWMKHLPRWMCPWRRFAENYFAEYSIYFGKQIAEVEARMKQGTQPPCVASTFIENRQKFGMTDQEAAWAATSL
ncbi:hypothetical protein AAF712_004746 [Marasmius tenuissimus]|uniref:Cytochrome P450 n=1 Tax=Marasmius tenuissimus TaxID=585030 RepID=A0ABR3A408_9AGAR